MFWMLEYNHYLGRWEGVGPFKTIAKSPESIPYRGLSLETEGFHMAESIATLPPFGHIEGHKGFDQISIQ
jgi:hypothetical protein